MAQKTLKINIFPVFSLLIREFWIKNISILLQILHTPPVFLLKSHASLLFARSDTSALTRAASIPSSQTPRIRVFYFENSQSFIRNKTEGS